MIENINFDQFCILYYILYHKNIFCAKMRKILQNVIFDISNKNIKNKLSTPNG